jgi:exodeoxyribonuclease V alpha subunit
MEEQVTVSGIVQNIIFCNEDNGYTVFSIEEEKEGQEVTCVGYLHKITTGESVKIIGNYILHPSYGKQLNVSFYEKSIPTTINGIEKYLASGIIKGIGEKLAKKIVKNFGEDTLSVIEEFPEKLSEIRGITIERAMTISAVFHEQAEIRQVMLFLHGYGISTSSGMKIYKKFKQNTYDVIKTNPYTLADEVFGIGFKVADDIAFKVGIEADSTFRIKAGVKHTLNKNTSNGHIYLPKQILIEQSLQLLELQSLAIENTLRELQMERAIVIETIEEKEVVYLNYLYYAQNYVSKKIIELSKNVIDRSEKINEDIQKVEEDTNIKLAEGQKQAVIQSMESGVVVITGGPGTGKTTTINTIINILKNDSYEVVLSAPTGRASKKMSDATGMEAKTIHRLLEISFASEELKGQSFGKDEDNPIEADIVIIDESSMVDIVLMCSLLKAIEIGSRLILVGDIDQLPSVGAGNVLRDIISSGCIKVVRLTEIFRQAQKSAIVMNAHRINKGEYPIINEKNKDFFFINKAIPEEIIATIIELVTKRLPSYVKGATISDIQVLTPMRKSSLGVNNLNKELQKHINPPHHTKKEKEYRLNIFRENDKVMQIKNNYNMVWQTIDESGKSIDEGLGVFNGDTGIIKEIDDYNEKICIIFDDNKRVEYDYTQLDELELSYAITIHKSQGSEYKVIVMPVYSGSSMLMSRNLLYTAITRAKELVVIVGIPEAMNKMIDNNRQVDRYSALDDKIKKMNSLVGDAIEE